MQSEKALHRGILTFPMSLVDASTGQPMKWPVPTPEGMEVLKNEMIEFGHTYARFINESELEQWNKDCKELPILVETVKWLPDDSDEMGSVVRRTAEVHGSMISLQERVVARHRSTFQSIRDGLYAYIDARKPGFGGFAGQITSMLLKRFDADELFDLLDSPSALDACIADAAVYALVDSRKPGFADKITSILLTQFRHDELLHLLDSPGGLDACVEDAVAKLDAPPSPPAPTMSSQERGLEHVGAAAVAFSFDEFSFDELEKEKLDSLYNKFNPFMNESEKRRLKAYMHELDVDRAAKQNANYLTSRAQTRRNSQRVEKIRRGIVTIVRQIRVKLEAAARKEAAKPALSSDRRWTFFSGDSTPGPPPEGSYTAPSTPRCRESREQEHVESETSRKHERHHDEATAAHRAELDRRAAVRTAANAAKVAKPARPYTAPGPSHRASASSERAVDPLDRASAAKDAREEARKQGSIEAARAHAEELRDREAERIRALEEKAAACRIAEAIVR